ncbi:hypothetical protein SGFS_004330 [Streptomyces graminofaciens]|uniref:Uncharacterized protein n=1 Tax=Streptomyces graminofaciens TaxID=68212 RepID=A0ABN5V759_9ACTN|nr:hypothetical protein SGFS_004330 [Streptomyces graminofaciens]
MDVSVYYPLVGAGVPAAELVQQVAHDSTWITTHLTDAIDPPYAQAVIRRLQRAPEARARVEAALTHTDTTTATNWLPARCRAVSVPCRVRAVPCRAVPVVGDHLPSTSRYSGTKRVRSTHSPSKPLPVDLPCTRHHARHDRDSAHHRVSGLCDPPSRTRGPLPAVARRGPRLFRACWSLVGPSGARFRVTCGSGTPSHGR